MDVHKLKPTLEISTSYHHSYHDSVMQCVMKM